MSKLAHSSDDATMDAIERQGRAREDKESQAMTQAENAERKVKHTPLPWGYDGDGFDSVAAQHCNTDGYTVFPVDEGGDCDGPSICEITDCGDDTEAEANAAFIVRACNAHYIYKEALEKLASLDGGTSEGNRIAQSAIAKAEGQ
jgi:hypothetical protein